MTAKILLLLVLKRRIKRFKSEISCSKTRRERKRVIDYELNNRQVQRFDEIRTKLGDCAGKKDGGKYRSSRDIKNCTSRVSQKIKDIVRVVKFLKSTFQKQNMCKPYNPQNLYISRTYRFRRFRSHVQPASGVHINRHVLGYRLRASQTMTTFHAMIVSARRKSLIHAARILDDQTRERTYAFVRKKRQT